MDTDKVRRRAYEKWEAEGHPDGAHERHWFEAEAEESDTGELPETWSSGGDHGVAPQSKGDGEENTTSEAVADLSGKPGSFKPGELASENK